MQPYVHQAIRGREGGKTERLLHDDTTGLPPSVRFPERIRFSREYERTISAAYDFGENRLETRVREHIPIARLFEYALRSLDAYQPTKRVLEKIAARELRKGDMEHLEHAITGLNFLSDLRYHLGPNDHRIFPSLRQYHEAITMVEESLASIRDRSAQLTSAYQNFCTTVEEVTSGNALHVVNWKATRSQNATLYTKVNLEISRIAAGELVGVYLVRVKGKGRVPHHLHTYLWEHHLLPEKIDGVHQLEQASARCTQSDILYIRPGQIHAFRNDEDQDRSFLFVCGSERTGPWDFVQDITTLPDLDFPKENSADVSRIGGRRLQDLLDSPNARRYDRSRRIRLTPEGARLSHHAIEVADTYRPPNGTSDVQYYVASGRGSLEIEHRSAGIRAGDIFVVPSNMPSTVVNRGELILYEFGFDL